VYMSGVSLPPDVSASNASADVDVELPENVSTDQDPDVVDSADCAVELPDDVTVSADRDPAVSADCDVELPADVSADEDSDAEFSFGFPGDFSDVELPEDDCMINGFDESVESFDDLVELPDDILCEEDDLAVPDPAVAEHLSMGQDIAEFYSVPRVLPCARRHGFRGSLSLDLHTGWDFRIPKLRDLSCRLLVLLRIAMLILSPPCTAFSFLQEMFNYKKLPVEVVQQKMAAAMILLRHALQCAKIQYEAGRLFVFEHPASATSWKLPEVKSMLELPGMHSVVFDQCMLGLKSKVHQIPMRKRTRLMTNSLKVAQAFRGVLCDRQHEHQVIQGCEGGVDRSAWAQRYPEPMVELLVAASSVD